MSSTGAEPGADPQPKPTPDAVAGPAGWLPPPAGPPQGEPAPAYGPPAPYAGQSSGPPMTAAPPYGQQPLMPWPTPPPPAHGNRGAIIAAVTVSVVLLVSCLGLGGFLLRRAAKSAVSSPVAGAPRSPTTGGRPGAGSADGKQAAQQGPRASAYPAKDVDDLDRVCDENVYYPRAPKRAGKAPHPVVLLIKDGSGFRYQNRVYYYAQGLSKKVEQTWAPSDPKKVQMVACLDRVSTGSRIRGCKFDDPKPETLTLLRAGWRLRVHEAATGRKLLDKAMTGDDQKCPSFALVYADKKIYAGVSDRVLVAALRNLVKG